MFGTFEGDEGEWMFFLNNRAFGWHNLKVLVDVVFQLVICCIGRKILHEQFAGHPGKILALEMLAISITLDKCAAVSL